MRQFRFFYSNCARRVVLMILTAFAVQHSAANEPVKESLRGGAGAPVLELPDVREQNNDRNDRYEMYADGLYVLPLFQTVSADRSYQVDVWNLLIGPGQETADFSLPGTAILLVRVGSPIVVVDDAKGTELEMGGTLVVKPESRLHITNRATDRPINIRVTMFSGTE